MTEVATIGGLTLCGQEPPKRWNSRGSPTAASGKLSAAVDLQQATLFAAPLAISLVFIVLIAGPLAWRGIVLDGRGGITLVISMTVGVIALALAARMRVGSTPILVMVEGFALLSLNSLLGAIACATVALGSEPYIDPALAALDRLILPGLDWPNVMRALPHHPWMLAALTTVYTSLTWQPVLFFLASLRLGSVSETVRYVCSSSMALLLCVLPFHWLPAQGAYTYFGIRMAELPGFRVPLAWQFPEKLAVLRHGVSAVDYSLLSGLITFPSYHAASAVVMARAFWKMRFLRLPMLGLNIAMFVAAVPMGGHYFVDVLAGAAVAASAIVLSEVIVNRSERIFLYRPKLLGAGRDVRVSRSSPLRHA